MDLKALNYLVTIEEEGSISRAADKLYMAQSSLSQFLAQYEVELGAPVFIRTSRGVRPTASGEVFLVHARKILQNYHQAQSEFWDIEEMKGGKVKLGISSFRGRYLLPRVLKAFMKKYPNVNVEITEKDSRDLEEMILEGLLDLALIAHPTSRLDRQLDLIATDEFCIIATSDHPVMKYVHEKKDGKKWVRFEDALRFEFILGQPKTILGSMARKAIDELKIEPKIQNENITAPFAAALAREGLALAPTYQSCKEEQPGVEYLSIGEEGITLDLALAFPAGEYRSKAVKELTKLIHELYS